MIGVPGFAIGFAGASRFFFASDSTITALLMKMRPLAPSLPDAGLRADRFRYGARESKFLAVLTPSSNPRTGDRERARIPGCCW
jgi:hypothetical protein